jgi:hypothetical protein
MSSRSPAFQPAAHRRIRRFGPALAARAAGALGAAAIAVASTGSASAAIVKGPHLQNVRTDGVTVLWEQQHAGPGVVTVGGVDHPSAGAGPVYEVNVTGLTPGTSYTYVVKADGATHAGAFVTAPADALAPFVFVAMGDNRSVHADHQKVVNAILTEGVLHLLLNSGDMVSSGDVASDWQYFFDIERDLIATTPWYPTVGNHEEAGGKLPSYYTSYLAPPTAGSGTEAFYSFRYGNTVFLSLDSQVNVEDQMLGLWTDFGAAQKAWLQGVLAKHDADPSVQHIFVTTHEPPFSSKDGRNGSHALRLLLPLFAQHHVDAVICGDDHYLERGESPGGVRYFTMGGGGAPLYENTSEGHLGYKAPKALPWLDDAHTVHFAKTTHGYMRVQIDNGKVQVRIKDTNGAVLETVSWNTGDIAPPDAGGADAAGTDADASDAAQPDSGLADSGQPDAGGPGGSAGDSSAHEVGVADGAVADASGKEETGAGGTGGGAGAPDGAAGASPGQGREGEATGSESGCGCRTRPARGASLAWILVPVLVWSRRRRRVESSRVTRARPAPSPP